MNHKPKILLVDDEKNFRELLKTILSKRGYSVHCADNGLEAIAQMERDYFDIVITDLMMDKMDGMALLRHIQAAEPSTRVIMITAYGSIENAVEAIKQGAFSYFIKSNSPQELIFEIEKIVELNKLSFENSILKTQNTQLDAMLHTKNHAFANVLELANRVAQTDANVLILGESGVGKEIITKYIHQQSMRKTEILVSVNCHSLSESLLEAELYGHEKGAFTGSTQMRIGRFEAAAGGTLFLDEIGDIPLSTQIKLLRNIESKEITRIGSNTPINVDFRLVCATNRDLQQEIEDKLFREDLYYRISTVTIQIPPLRERKEDLPLLIEFFLKKSQLELKKEISHMDESLMALLMAYDYPGNIRELKNIIERLIVMAKGKVLTLEDAEKYSILPKPAQTLSSAKVDNQSLKEIRAAAEKKHIEEILCANHNDMEKSAEILQISSRQLYNKVKEYEILIRKM